MFEQSEANSSLSGFLRSSIYVGNTAGEKKTYFQGVYTQLGLRVNGKAGKWATGKAELRFKYGAEFQQPISQMEIREAYVNLTAGPALFKIGKIIAPWGNASVFNPTGKLTPMDPTVRSPDEDDMYIGTWAVQGRIKLGTSMQLTATLKPIYQPSILLIEPVPMPDYVDISGKQFPGLELDHGSYGFRYDLYSSVLDGSIYWFDGWHHWPGLAYDSMELNLQTLSPDYLKLTEQAYKVQMLGMDLSIPLGSWIFRTEAAWQRSDLSALQHEYVPFPELSYTLEIERSGSSFTLLGGYYGKYILEYAPPLADASLSTDPKQFIALFESGFVFSPETIDQMISDRIGAFNRLYNSQIEEVYHTFFAIGKLDLWHSQLELTLPIIYNLSTEELIMQPGLNWLPTDGTKITAGFNGYYGPENSLFDLVGPVLNAAFISLKLSF